MKTDDKITDLISQNNGYLITSQSAKNGISRQSVLNYSSQNNLERIAPGIYITEQTWEDPMYVLQLRNPTIVFSHESALLLHGLTEKEPDNIVVSVQRGYNATHLKQSGISVHTIIKDNFSLGISEAKTFYGNSVRVYDKERTVCDIIRNKQNMDIQVFNHAIKQYMRSKEKDIVRLSQYARIFRISDKIHFYTEVLL